MPREVLCFLKPVNAQRNSNSQWLVIAFLLGLFLLLLGVAPRAQASYTASPLGQAATPTLGTSDNPGSVVTGTVGAPQPVGTAGAAQTATANAVGPVSTGAVPQGVSTGVVVPQGGAGGTSASTSSSSNGSFPWLIIIGIALLVLAGIGFALLRPRRTVEVSAGSDPGAPRASGLRTVPAPGRTTSGTTSTTATTTQANTPDRAAVNPASATPVAQQATTPLAPAPLPATVKCPNCGTINSTDEKFCHECGQDLRPLLAQMASTSAAPAAQVTAPVDVIDDTTPYLETLDRTNEQLEFVLSRPKIGIGTAPGNDIIIDNLFKGWQTVSPRHAEMHRDQDGFVIADLGSEYGTFVNEMRTGENLLANGDLIRLGDVRFVFHIPAAED